MQLPLQGPRPESPPSAPENHPASLRPGNRLGLPSVQFFQTTTDFLRPGRLRILVNGFIEALDQRSGWRNAGFCWELEGFIQQLRYVGSHAADSTTPHH